MVSKAENLGSSCQPYGTALFELFLEHTVTIFFALYQLALSCLNAEGRVILFQKQCKDQWTLQKNQRQNSFPRRQGEKDKR